ncbi:hypothetical protein [Deinococcus sp. UYEF24]
MTENLSFGMQFPRRGPFIDWKAAARQAETALERIGGGIRPDARIRSLPRTERALVVWGRSIKCSCRAQVTAPD